MVQLSKALMRNRTAANAAAPMPAPSHRTSDDRPDASFADLLAALIRRKWTIAATTGLFAGAALAYIMVTPKLYTAGAAVLLELRSSVSQQDTLRFSFASDSTLVDSQIKIISSEAVLRRVVDRENLQNDPELGTPEIGIFAKLKRAVGLGMPASEQAEESANAAVESLAKALSVRRPERTYVMEINVTARDPKKSARLTNAVAEAYIADQADARGDLARREEEFLEGSITRTREKIRKAEDAVEQFKRKNQIVGAAGKLVNEQLLNEVNSELAQTRVKTSEAKARAEQVRRLIASGKPPDALADALKSPVIDKLRVQIAEISRAEANAKTTLGERHPQYLEIQQQLRDTRRLISEELNRIGESARNDARAAQAQEDDLSAQVEQLKKETGSTNQSIVAMRELEREVESNRAVLDNLLKAKASVTRDSGDMPIARMIARATPPTAASAPRRIPIMLLALVTGLGLGTVLALLLEHWRAVRNGPAQSAAPEETDIPVTLLPAPSRARTGNKPHTLLDRSTDPAFAEVTASNHSDYARAVKGLADAAMARSGSDETGPRKILLIGQSSDEKTALLAANLAQALAAARHRTMVIDNGDSNTPLCRIWSPNSAIGQIAFANGAQRIAIAVANSDNNRLLIVPARAATDGIERLPPLVSDIDQSLDCILFNARSADIAADAKLLIDANIVIIHGGETDGIFEISPGLAQALSAANSNVLIAVDQAA